MDVMGNRQPLDTEVTIKIIKCSVNKSLTRLVQVRGVTLIGAELPGSNEEKQERKGHINEKAMNDVRNLRHC